MLIVMVGVVSALHVGKLPPAIPVLSDSLGLGLVQGGFLLSIIQLAGMTLGAVAGTVADRMGPRRIMLTGLLLLASGSCLGAIATTPGFLLVTRAIEGMGFLMAVLPAPVLLRAMPTRNHSSRLSLGMNGKASTIAARTASSLALPTTATCFASMSTTTDSMPSRAPTSASMADLQWPQLMPGTR
jgi:MFS family permease